MAQRPRLELRATQRQTLSTSLQTGMALLALPGERLTEALVALAEENPLIEVIRPSLEERRTLPGAPSAYDYALATVTDAPTLGDELRAQIGAQRLPDQIYRAALAISWSLDDRGFLDTEEHEIAASAEVSLDAVHRALAVVQACQPTGVGARSLAECLTLQLVAKGFDADTSARAMGVVDDIVAGRWGRAAERTGLPKTVLRRFGAELPRLTPAPGAQFSPSVRPLSPDLVLRIGPDGSPVLSLATGSEPDIHLRDAPNGAEGAFLESQRRLFDQTVRALAFRRQTLLRVGAQIMLRQKAFFADGAQAMRPLTRAEIAEDLGLHPSTIGRCMSGKSLAHPRGITPLSAFCPAPVGPDASAFAVQHRLAEMVASESPERVLSDDQLAHRLQAEGVDIARRTVAKYRGVLSIPPSHVRKRSHALRQARRVAGRLKAPRPD